MVTSVNNHSSVSSPLTNNSAVELRQYECRQIAEKYKQNFDYDISYLLGGNKHIRLFECKDTGYKFYYPFDIAGDSKFYEYFQQFDWYYLPWKWEHQMALENIETGMKVLEVGCAKGAFIEKVATEKGAIVTGLELNEEAARFSQSRHLDVINQTIESHVQSKSGYYDVVCSFQVLEHISNVNSFIKAQVDSLRAGGRLVICVPDNDSFIKYYDGGILNFPPHHMGLWNSKSLSQLTKYFDLEIEKVIKEPLQEYHIPWYVKYLLDRYVVSRRLKSLLVRMRINNLLEYLVGLLSSYINGHSIFVVYKKRTSA